ncbi:MAG: VOC family protein [Sphingopyxis sp.]|uniref:Glyoxalase n=1 Tax=Sphingopyxis terrae subsp. terrae NBRC 15098 TaxID=1219058 RepID=A0A142VX01_9SPHN|nr:MULTISPECIES: VOC family protein [Sphingopyxis]AMU94340.1 glyoxalase [Sphingopyxis terrae subsp. terrae NBRC 15098]QXF10833.1 VOC family protein [Sphingopyxis terrae subsp. terrae]
MENQGPTGGLTPHIAIADKRASEAIEFYKQAFGAVEQVRMPAEDGVRLMHAHLLLNGSSLMMHDDFPEYSGEAMAAPSGVTLHLQVDDADRWYDRAIAAGATSVMAPDNMFWGDRYAQVKDPFGHLWSIGHPLKGDE